MTCKNRRRALLCSFPAAESNPRDPSVRSLARVLVPVTGCTQGATVRHGTCKKRKHPVLKGKGSRSSTGKSVISAAVAVDGPGPAGTCRAGVFSLRFRAARRRAESGWFSGDEASPSVTARPCAPAARGARCGPCCTVTALCERPACRVRDQGQPCRCPACRPCNQEMARSTSAKTLGDQAPHFVFGLFFMCQTLWKKYPNVSERHVGVEILEIEMTRTQG